MKSLNILIPIVLGIQYLAFGQVKFDRTSFDYGMVENWKNPAVSFKLTNTGNASLTILPLASTRDLEVKFPGHPIPQNESATIIITYYTEKTGPFHKKIPIYITTSNKPAYLTIKGNIISISEDAFIECPTICQNCPPKSTSEPEESEMGLKVIGKVLDNVTRRPIEGATVQLVKDEKPKYEVRTLRNGRFQGEVSKGSYTIKVSADGYSSKSETKTFEKLITNLVVKLDPVGLVASENEPVIPLDPTSKRDDEDIHAKVGGEELVEKKIESKKPTPSPKTDKNEELVEEKNEPEKPTPSPKTEEKVILPNPPPADSRTQSKVENEVPPDRIEELPLNEFNPNNVVFLIDVSLSMSKENKLDLLKASIKRMVAALRDIDRLAIITYRTKAQLVLPSMVADDKEFLYDMIDALEAKGLTLGINGLNRAYEVAKENLITPGNNQIVLATDGLFNSEDEAAKKNIFTMARRQSYNTGIILSVVGFGKDEQAILLMEKLAKYGKGNYIPVSTRENAEKALIEEIKANSRIIK